MVSGDDFMKSATLVMVTENFRQSDISGEKTCCPSFIRRIDQVKTWNQKIHAKWAVSVKVHMQERHAGFIDSGEKRLVLLYHSIPKEVWQGTSLIENQDPSSVASKPHMWELGLDCVCFPLYAARAINSIMTWSYVKVFFFVSFLLVYFFIYPKFWVFGWCVCVCVHMCACTLTCMHTHVKSPLPWSMGLWSPAMLNTQGFISFFWLMMWYVPDVKWTHSQMSSILSSHRSNEL